jgi:hypothetical protein
LEQAQFAQFTTATTFGSQPEVVASSQHRQQELHGHLELLRLARLLFCLSATGTTAGLPLAQAESLQQALTDYRGRNERLLSALHLSMDCRTVMAIGLP